RVTGQPGDADESEMMVRVTLDDDDESLMPPAEHGRRLSADEVDTLRRWIDQGGKWGKHWSFAPPKRHKNAAAHKGGFLKSPIDSFILSKLKQTELRPSAPATPDRWLRRVTLDITGVPPTIQQRAAFLDDVAQRGEPAYKSAVDQLLASPRYGERWASVWLDVIRYADSRGMGADGRRNIWKYRDWVIRSLNNDVPYNEFTVSQLAGDLLPDGDLGDLLATAAHRVTQTNEEGGTDDETFRMEAVIDRVNTTWQAWQGISFGCVQCHSHPYDPIEHEEYYKFFAFFNNTADYDLGNGLPTAPIPNSPDDYDAAARLDADIRHLKEQVWQRGIDVANAADWSALKEAFVATNNSTGIQSVPIDSKEDDTQDYVGVEIQTVGNVAKNTRFDIDCQSPVETIYAIRLTGLPEDLEKARKDSEFGFVFSEINGEVLPAVDDAEDQPADEGDSSAKKPAPKNKRVKFAYVLADDPHPLHDPQLSLNGKSGQGFGGYPKFFRTRTE
ncbi:MAG: DUF1549 domain-containing protein, partial [Planctomycetota bacterium]